MSEWKKYDDAYNIELVSPADAKKRGILASKSVFLIGDTSEKGSYVDSEDIKHIVKLTQEEYDEITPSDDTLYVITEE